MVAVVPLVVRVGEVGASINTEAETTTSPSPPVAFGEPAAIPA
jgi:hypothetical protein